MWHFRCLFCWVCLDSLDTLLSPICLTVIHVVFQEPESPDLDLSEDEELTQQFDMHSLIVSSLQAQESDRVATADEVISEIETMMQVLY